MSRANLFPSLGTDWCKRLFHERQNVYKDNWKSSCIRLNHLRLWGQRLMLFILHPHLLSLSGAVYWDFRLPTIVWLIILPLTFFFLFASWILVLHHSPVFRKSRASAAIQVYQHHSHHRQCDSIGDLSCCCCYCCCCRTSHQTLLWIQRTNDLWQNFTSHDWISSGSSCGPFHQLCPKGYGLKWILRVLGNCKSVWFSCLYGFPLMRRISGSMYEVHLIILIHRNATICCES